MAEIVSLKREETADVTPEGGMLRITLNNPPANVLSLEVMRDIQAQLDRARDDASVRVVVIASEGKIFCAGHDLKQLNTRRADADAGRAYFEETFDTCTKLMLSIVRHPKPVIAEVGGLATAAGCQLVASCDLAIASDQATFGVNGINVGLFCTTPGVALVRGLKPKHAMEMLLTGEMVDAATAKEFGLGQPRGAGGIPAAGGGEICPHHRLEAAGDGDAWQAGFLQAGGDGAGRSLRSCLARDGGNLLADDAREGMSAFVEKRKPVWKAE
jgi:enoyl-CoA hydratase/carnithine racemase